MIVRIIIIIMENETIIFHCLTFQKKFNITFSQSFFFLFKGSVPEKLKGV